MEGLEDQLFKVDFGIVESIIIIWTLICTLFSSYQFIITTLYYINLCAGFKLLLRVTLINLWKLTENFYSTMQYIEL
jgi:hypothetical protein